MRQSLLLPLLVVGACASHASVAPPPAAPTPAPTAPTPAPAPTSAVTGWYCFADVQGAGSDCSRTLDACQRGATAWENYSSGGGDDDGGSNQSTACTAQSLAYCYTYVAVDAPDGESTTLCSQTLADCQTGAGVAKAKDGTMTACVVVQ